MGVTTLLLPLLEPEAEALIEGGAAAAEAMEALKARARRWRTRVGWVDGAREELHERLFPLWEAARPRPQGAVARLLALFRKPEPASASQGYDPFVHVFGRSLPLDGPSPRVTAERLASLDALDDAAFDVSLLASLATLDPEAPACLTRSPRPQVGPELEAAIEAEARKVARAVSGDESLSGALDGLARLAAWSQPLWRLDGETLPEVLSALGVEVLPGPASGLFELEGEKRPGLVERASRLPSALPAFAGAGGFLSSSDVKLVAGAMRLRRGQLAQNAASAEYPAVLMRHARLLEEAVSYCESAGLGLLEGAGVEWHERQG